MRPVVALIGYGEVGRIFARDLSAGGFDAILAYDILFDAHDPACAPPARAVSSTRDAVSDARLVVSAVTAGSAIDVAASAAGHIAPRTFFFDVNSVSPGTKRKAFALIEAVGGCYVEVAVMSAVTPLGLKAPMLLGGPHAEAFVEAFPELDLNATVYSADIGAASAVKMCRSVVIKGMEALMSESLVTARHFGVQDAVLQSLTDTLPHANWQRLAAYMIARSVKHGRRRAEEMREVAATVEEAGLQPLLSLATAERQDWAHRRVPLDGFPAVEPELETILAGLGARS